MPWGWWLQSVGSVGVELVDVVVFAVSVLLGHEVLSWCDEE